MSGQQVKISDFVGKSEIVNTIASHFGNGHNKKLEAVIYVSVDESLNVTTSTSFRVKNNNTDFIVTNNLKEALDAYNKF